MKSARMAPAGRTPRRASRLGKASARTRSIARLKVLVIVDLTDASRRALQYVGRILGGREDAECHVAYVASRLPPELLESGGSELPEREEQIESDLRQEQRRWIDQRDKQVERVLSKARAILQRAGVSAGGIHTCVSSPLDVRRVVDEVLLLARDEGCRTIVVGHQAHMWFRGLGGGHLAEQLVRRAKGFAVWVVD